MLVAYPAFSQCPHPGPRDPRGAVEAPVVRAVRSPEILPDNRVTFRIAAPGATEVAVSGEWQDGSTPMTKDQQGVWSVTVGPLKPDMYAYSFLVNGVRAMDPQNARYRRAGSRFDSIIIVPGPESSLYEFHDVPHGIVSEVWYNSASLGLEPPHVHLYPAGLRTGLVQISCYVPPTWRRKRRTKLAYEPTHQLYPG